MRYAFRFGQADDIPAIRDFILDAGAGLFEYVLNGVLPAVDAHHLIELAVADPSSTLCYRNALVAEAGDGNLAGVALCYPAQDYGLPLVARSIIPKARLRTLTGMLNHRVDNTLYLNTLATASWARGEGLGGTLLDLALEWAAESGYHGLSLHVWADNAAAVELYRARHYREVARFQSPGSPEFRYSGPILLIYLPLSSSTDQDETAS